MAYDVYNMCVQTMYLNILVVFFNQKRTLTYGICFVHFNYISVLITTVVMTIISEQQADITTVCTNAKTGLIVGQQEVITAALSSSLKCHGYVLVLAWNDFSVWSFYGYELYVTVCRWYEKEVSHNCHQYICVFDIFMLLLLCIHICRAPFLS